MALGQMVPVDEVAVVIPLKAGTVLALSAPVAG
jgi:hypothetical protein